jgi:hypothetical protein
MDMELVWLPRAARRLFRGLAILCGVLFVVVLLFAWIDPVMPGRGMAQMVNLMGEPRELSFQNPELAALFAKRGAVSLLVPDQSSFNSAIFHAMLPFVLLETLYFCVLFEVMSRLFRNVENGQSFTRQSVHFVQAIGFSLLVLFLVDAVAGNWFYYFFLDFVTSHGVPLNTGHVVFSQGGKSLKIPMFVSPKPSNIVLESVFEWSTLFTGLLVLALSEVFRQGLKLKKESDLTI